jgi:7-carboxy-7-deazaguanine synthase
MRIAEIFHSIQGEGELTGVPSVFIRTSGCNLRCQWCDTRYASWEPEGADLSEASILERVAQHPVRHVVLTGGEPMVARGIHSLAAALRAGGYHITIETAATVPPEGIACDLASLSPKLGHSQPTTLGPGWAEKHEALRRQPSVLRQWLEHSEFQLKFVLESEADLEEMEALLAETGTEIPPWKVQLMPQGITRESLLARQSELLDLCKKRGYRYCARLHIDLFGNRRGT